MRHITLTLLAFAAILLTACNAPETRLRGHIVDPVNRTVTDGEIVIRDGRIESVTPCDGIEADAPFLMPGFVDSHVHIESSMMLPSEFARIALRHGTVGIVCDPHEIGNVLGVDGVKLMIDDARGVPFHFAFGVPSCVPSCGSEIETSGQVIDSRQVAELLQMDEVYCLAEMMNYPGVLSGDEEVMSKIAAAQAVGKPVDGHAPNVVGDARRAYAAAGISTDHECSGLEEARDAIACGMKVLIREGSAAKNYTALSPLIGEAPESVMLCTDDSHPTDFINGHINRLVARALGDGYALMDVLQAACVNPVRHYHMPIGLLQPGDPADLIVVSDTTAEMRVLETYIAGCKAGELAHRDFVVEDRHQVCVAAPLTAEDLRVEDGYKTAIVAYDGSLLTGEMQVKKAAEEQLEKMVTYNRYTPDAKPSICYISGFDMERGAIAQTIAHDCHNIVAIGTDDDLLVEAINRVIELKGGIVVTDGEETVELALPIAGLISPASGELLAEKNLALEEMARRTGCTMHSPFITLGFMSLPVIPNLKLTDKGLFDGRTFEFVE